MKDDDLDRFIADRTAKNPDFPKLMTCGHGVPGKYESRFVANPNWELGHWIKSESDGLKWSENFGKVEIGRWCQKCGERVD